MLGQDLHHLLAGSDEECLDRFLSDRHLHHYLRNMPHPGEQYGLICALAASASALPALLILILSSTPTTHMALLGLASAGLAAFLCAGRQGNIRDERDVALTSLQRWIDARHGARPERVTYDARELHQAIAAAAPHLAGQALERRAALMERYA